MRFADIGLSYLQYYCDCEAGHPVLLCCIVVDLFICFQFCSQNSRRGCFQRVFPSMSSNKFLRFFESQVSLVKDGQTMHTCGNANWSYIMDKMTSRRNCEHYVEKLVTNY